MDRTIGQAGSSDLNNEDEQAQMFIAQIKATVDFFVLFVEFPFTSWQ